MYDFTGEPESWKTTEPTLIAALSGRKYTREDVEIARTLGDVANGIAFDWWPISDDWDGFCLLVEPHHTDIAIAIAEATLRLTRNVIGAVRVEHVE